MPLEIPKIRSYAMLVRAQSKLLATTLRRPCYQNIFAAMNDEAADLRWCSGDNIHDVQQQSRRSEALVPACVERNLWRLCEQILELLLERLRVPQVLRLAALRERTLLLSNKVAKRQSRRSTIEKRVQFSITRMLLYFISCFLRVLFPPYGPSYEEQYPIVSYQIRLIFIWS